MQTSTRSSSPTRPLRLRRATLAFIGVVAVVAAAALTADSSLFSLNPADQLYVSIWSLALILACSVVHALYVQKQSASAPEMKTPPNA